LIGERTYYLNHTKAVYEEWPVEDLVNHFSSRKSKKAEADSSIHSRATKPFQFTNLQAEMIAPSSSWFGVSIPPTIQKWSPSVYETTCILQSYSVAALLPDLPKNDEVTDTSKEPLLVDGLPFALSLESHAVDTTIFGLPYLMFRRTKTLKHALNGRVYLSDRKDMPMGWDVLFGFLDVIGARTVLRKLREFAIVSLDNQIPVGVSIKGIFPTVSFHLYMETLIMVDDEHQSDDRPPLVPPHYTLVSQDEKSKNE
jgi:hypothetical protein